MKTQLQHYHEAARQVADANQTFLELVNSPTNPLTREDLAAAIDRRPALWGRFSGWLERLPTRAEVAGRGASG